MALTTQQVQTFYIAYLARAGESAGVNAWSAPTFNITEAEAAAAFFNSPEATALYPTARTDVAAYVDAVYNNLFGRAAEPAGKAAWVNYINSGAITIEQVPYVIATGAANEDLQALNGKITVATQYTNQVGANYNTDAARAMLKKITSTDPASYTPEALAADLAEALNNVSPGPTPGGTFMLTEGVDYADASKSTHDDVADTFKFTDASEKITATFAQLSKGDQLIDLSNADNDTLDLSLDINNVKQTIGSKNGATLVNIEELDITSRGAKNITFDNTISAAGLKTIKIAGSFLNEKGNDGNGFTFNGNVLKTLTTIDASAITAGNVNIDASKATQDLTITGPNFAASINGGSGNDTITGQGTINAGAGDDIITITGKSNVTGGEGKDTFDVQAEKVTITDLGAGKDIIKVAAGAEVTATVTGEFVVSESNYVNDGSVTFKVAADGVLDLSKADGNITSIEITGTGAKVVGTVGDDTITVGSGASGTVKGGDGNDKIDASAAIGAVTITGGEGADTITGGAGDDNIDLTETTPASDTIIFGASKAANGVDTITGFTAGSGGDVLDVSEFLNATASVDRQTGTGTSASQVDTTFGKNVIVLSSSALTATNIKFTGANNTEYVVINENDKKVYFYTAKNDTTVSLSSVLTADNQVATLTGVDAKTLVDDNFIGIAP